MSTIEACIKNCPMLINGVKRIVDEVGVTLRIYGVEVYGDEIDTFEVDYVTEIGNYELDLDEKIETEEIVEDEVDWDNNVEYFYDTIELDNPYDDDYWYEEYREMRA